MNNEGAFWGKVRDTLHEPAQHRLARKLSDNFSPGVPDCWYAIDGVVGFLELKFLPHWPVRAETCVSIGSGVTADQARYLDMLAAAWVPAHVLLGVGEGRGKQALFLIPPVLLPATGEKVAPQWLREATKIVRPGWDTLVQALRDLRHEQERSPGFPGSRADTRS